MSRRAAGDPLPLWVKVMALVAPISLAGGYLAYQSEQEELDNVKSLRVSDDMGVQFHSGASSDEAPLELGLATGSGNIGSQGGVYQERMLDLSAKEASQFSADDSAQDFLKTDETKSALLPGAEAQYQPTSEEPIRFLPASSELGSSQP